MADEDDPLDVRLSAAAAHFVALGDKMQDMAVQVRKLQRQATVCEEQRVFDLQRELLKAEVERNEARGRAERLEDDIEAMRLDIRSPEEVIERAGEWQPESYLRADV